MSSVPGPVMPKAMKKWYSAFLVLSTIRNERGELRTQKLPNDWPLSVASTTYSAFVALGSRNGYECRPMCQLVLADFNLVNFLVLLNLQKCCGTLAFVSSPF